MKTRLLSLAVLLLAGAAQGALAQDARPGGDDDGRGAAHGPAGSARGAAGIPSAPAGGHAPQPGHGPQAGQAPHAPSGEAGAPGQPAWRGGDRGGPRPGFGGQPGGQPGARPGAAPWADGRRPEGARPPASPPQEWSRQPGGDGWRQRRFEDQGRPPEDRGPPAEAEGRGPPSGPRAGGRPDFRPGPPGFDRGPDREREADWDRGRADARPWAPHAYPPSYRSEQRYHGPEWRPPRGYYYRAWRYGEILPYGWYGQDYWLDWSDYDLPEPPPGYDWVRVGADALLVEDGSGRIVQVVRAVFW